MQVVSQSMQSLSDGKMIQANSVTWDHCTYARLLAMTDNMLGPSPMHIKYVYWTMCRGNKCKSRVNIAKMEQDYKPNIYLFILGWIPYKDVQTFYFQSAVTKSWSTAIYDGRVSIIAIHIVTWWHYYISRYYNS